MKLKLEDKTLVDDYLLALTKVEKILWQGSMGKPPKYLENYNPNYFFEAFLLFLLFFFIFLISNGGIFFLLFLLWLPSYVFLSKYYRRVKEKKLDLVHAHTQYLVTNKRIIFVLHQKETLSIQSIPYENIKKVYSGRILEDAANIYFITNKPTGFQTVKFWSQEPHDKIVMVQVEGYQRILDLIQGHLF
jgi:hypothetical protein